jgi:drug/metabolite transporter, DME family
MTRVSASSLVPPTGSIAWQGRALIVCAAILWSTSGFFAKAPLFAGWSGTVLAFWRAVFASLLLVHFVRRPTWSWGLLPMVLIFAAMNVTYLTTMSRTEATVAIWLQNTAPAWVFLGSVCWLREPVQRRDLGLLVLVAIGVGLILFHELQTATPLTVLYGLAAGLTYAGVVLSIRQLRQHDASWLIALNHLGAVLVLSPAAIGSEHWPAGKQWIFLAAFGMLQMGLPYFLFARGLKYVPSHQAATLGLLEPLLVPVWVFLAWGGDPSYDPPSGWTMAGGSCILVGLLYRYLGRTPMSVKQQRMSIDHDDAKTAL